MNSNLKTWHDVVSNQDKAKLSAILDDEVIFYSPIVHTPQKGKQLALLYLTAALQILLNDSFKYVKELTNETETFLEFEVAIDGILINGIDMISWDEKGKIVSFKVMIRPLKAVNLIHQKMEELLMKYQRKMM